MEILNYTKEVLSRLMINMEIRKDNDFSNPHIRAICNRIKMPEEREVLRFDSFFDVQFIIFRFNGDIVLIGPFLMKYLSEADIDETLLSELGGTKHQLLNIPVVPSSGLFMPLMNTLFDYLWGEGEYIWRREDDKKNLNIVFDDLEHYNADEIAKRYKQESQLLDAVKRCDFEFLSRLSSAFDIKETVEKRNKNPVRNIQNYSIIMNTLLRKTAYDAGVEAVYVDRLSSAFGKRIESLSTSMAASNIMIEMLSEYAYLIRDYSWSGYPEAIKTVRFIVDSRYKEHLTLDDLCRSAGLSKSYLSRLFKRVMGKSIFEYINEVRVSKSLLLLKNPQITISQASLECGFEDQAYYTRIFKRIKGVTPTEWRMENKNIK